MPERSLLVQGYSRVLALACGLALYGLALPARACDLLPLVPLAPDLWWVPARGAEGDASNRGHAAHVLLARDGRRLWAIGTGPTPAWGERLACTARRQLGLAVTDAVVPWAQAESALGLGGLAGGRSWAHEQVVEAMREQCPHCVERLRQRLGEAAVDLGDDPVRIPAHALRGTRGRLGPFEWRRMTRSATRVTTLWRHRASGLRFAPGLLWGDGPPDLRDTDLQPFERSLQALTGMAASRWLGQTGPAMSAAGVRAQLAYVQALRELAQRAMNTGELAPPAPAAPLTATAGEPPLPDGVAERHALNWQRVWRQVEDDWLRAAR